MKKLMKKQGGFTLIEIIVVLIILGVLAAIALPSLFSNIAKSKGAEALASLSGYRSQIEGCVQGHPGSENLCNNPPGVVGNFNYTLTTAPSVANGGDWTIQAASAIANAPGNVILTRTGGETASPLITCSGTTTFAGIC